jgi:hypothetical protein
MSTKEEREQRIKDNRQAAKDRTNKGGKKSTLDEWRDEFLAELRRTCVVSHSARFAGTTRNTVNYYKATNAEFSKQFDDAREEAVSMMEVEAVDRSMGRNGRKYSDNMLRFILRARKPELYNPGSRVELSGTNGGPIRTDQKITVDRAEAFSALAKDPEAMAAMKLLAQKEAQSHTIKE